MAGGKGILGMRESFHFVGIRREAPVLVNLVSANSQQN